MFSLANEFNPFCNKQICRTISCSPDQSSNYETKYKYECTYLMFSKCFNKYHSNNKERREVKFALISNSPKIVNFRISSFGIMVVGSDEQRITKTRSFYNQHFFIFAKAKNEII